MKTHKYILSSISKTSIFFFFLFLILDNISLFADEFFGQKISTGDIKWEKINSEKLRSKDKIIKWEKINSEKLRSENKIIKRKNLSKEYENEAQQRITNGEVKQSLGLFSQNRSIAFSDGSIGPDIGWKLPNGFKWNDTYSFDLSARGFSGQVRNGRPFFQWNNGDATGQAHWKTFATKDSSFGLNGSIRSLYKGEKFSGGSTGYFEEGLSLGFRYDRKLNTQSGFAVGGEQLIQLDNKTDTGRNIYLMKSKGIWLNNKKKDFPLLVINGGIASGRFASNENIHLFCFEDFDKERSLSSRIDKDLCFGPVGSISLLPNKSLSFFTEYNSDQLVLAASKKVSIFRPIRLTFGVNILEPGGSAKFKNEKEFNWVFRISTAL